MKRLGFLFIFLLFQLPSFAQISIQMEEDNGIYKVPCKINGLKLKFIFDTGASTVSISSSIANMMLEQDYLSPSDIIGSGASVIADGQIVDHTKIILKEIEISGMILRNIEAVVIHQQSAPLLLGQTAIQKLGRISISGNVLTISSYSQPSLDDDSSYNFDEIWDVFTEAKSLHFDGFDELAVEKFDLVNKHSDIFLIDKEANEYYANCLSKVGRIQEAIDLYLSIEEYYKTNRPDKLKIIYCYISTNYYLLKDYNSSIKYGLLSIRYSNPTDLACYLSSCCIFNSYLGMGEKYKAKNAMESYIKKYCSFMEVSPTDCWDKGYKDPNLGTAYYDLTFLYKTYGEAEKYTLISAAWGNESAIEDCRKMKWSINKKPYDYVY